MHKIAKFYKVSFEQFFKDFSEKFPNYTEDEVRKIYDGIKLPKRGSKRSAGYDIPAPFDISLPFGSGIVIPTGLRCRIEEDWFLDLNPRSGHGFKYGIRIANTRGIIDSDYFEAKNEGHIMAYIVNNDEVVNSRKATFEVEKGNGFCQGIFTIYGITEDDDADADRVGGFGSTDNNK